MTRLRLNVCRSTQITKSPPSLTRTASRWRFYEAGELVGMQDFPHVNRALAAFVARPAVVRGLGIPARAV